MPPSFFYRCAGAIELRSEILANLSRRFMARTIKLVLGPQVNHFFLWLLGSMSHHGNSNSILVCTLCALSRLPSHLCGYWRIWEPQLWRARLPNSEIVRNHVTLADRRQSRPCSRRSLSECAVDHPTAALQHRLSPPR